MNHCLRICFALGGLVMVGALLLTACGPRSTASNTNRKASLGSNITMANAALNHTPSGNADLLWSPATQSLVVKLALTGLTPKSVHPAYIHQGTCRQQGNVKYTLNSLVANAVGMANSVTTLRNVTGGIPQTTWSISVHNGASAPPGEQQLVISCANVQSTAIGTSGTATGTPGTAAGVQKQVAQQFHTALGASFSPNQQASGVAQLRLSDNSLTVTVTMTGLQPKSVHAVSIYSGACQVQGRALYALKSVTADAQGNGSSVTIVNGVNHLPGRGWYVNVRLTNAPAAQVSNEPIACGNVMTANGY